MRKLIVSGLLLSVVLVVPALLAQKGDAAAGKTVYTAKCGTCHGPQGEPKEAIAKMMKVDMKHLGSKEVQAKTDADWKKEIEAGTGKMKPVKLVKDSDMADLIAFMRTLKK